MTNQKPLPAHLQGMTQAEWDTLSPREREAARDMSACNAQLLPYVGKRVRVAPKREYGLTTFRVGISSGWQPILLAMRNDPRQRGSSDIIGAEERFDSVTEVH